MAQRTMSVKCRAPHILVARCWILGGTQDNYEVSSLKRSLVGVALRLWYERFSGTRVQLRLIGERHGMRSSPMSRTCPSFLDRLVGEKNGACRVRLGGDQSQRRSACVLKEPLALAQNQRTDNEQILIDEVLMHERADQVTTAQDRYGLVKLLLEPGHLFGDIVLDQPGIVPCHLLEGG